MVCLTRDIPRENDENHLIRKDKCEEKKLRVINKMNVRKMWLYVSMLKSENAQKEKAQSRMISNLFSMCLPIRHRNFTAPDSFHTIHDLYCSAFAHLISGSPVLLPVYCCLQLNLWFRVIYCHLLWRQINNAFGQHSPIKNKLFKLFTFPFDSRC